MDRLDVEALSCLKISVHLPVMKITELEIK